MKLKGILRGRKSRWFVGLPAMAIFTGAVYHRAIAKSEAPRPYHFPSAELAALDCVVQERMADMNNLGNGAQRVGKIRRTFHPKNDGERRVVEHLNKAGTQVLFYAIHGPGKPFRPNAMCNPMKGPIRLSVGEIHPQPSRLTPVQLSDAPNEKDLMALAERIWNEPALANGVSSRSGRWKVEAVPVVANRMECVQCHTPPKPESVSWMDRFKPAPKSLALGDPLGVAFYCYESS